MISCRRLVGAVTFLTLLSLGHVSAAQQSTATASANVEIVSRSLSLTFVNRLSFGRMKSADEGEVDVDVKGIRTATGGVTLIGSGQCTTELCDDTNQSNPNSASFWSPGVFIVSGVPNAAYRVVSPSTATAMLQSGSGGPTSLGVLAVVAATNSSGYSAAIGQLDANGQDTIRIGGRLQVPANLNAASYYAYDADVPVIVSYN